MTKVNVNKEAAQGIIDYLSDQVFDFTVQMAEGNIDTMEGARNHVFYKALQLEEDVHGICEMDIDVGDKVDTFKGTADELARICMAQSLIGEDVTVSAGGSVSSEFTGSITGMKEDADNSPIITVEDLDGDSFDVSVSQIQLK
jgi:hypothetical protein